MNENIKSLKEKLRKRVWDTMEATNIAMFPRPVHGRIPNFKGAETAANKLFQLEIWKNSKVVKVNPDSPQRIIRYRALQEGKTLIMPTPKLKSGFLLLDPRRIPRSYYDYASTIKGAFKYGINIPLERIPNIDLIVTGSVLVDIYGNRIGKGGGYGDLEYGILTELDKISDKTPVVTTVHDIQVFNEELPYEDHDIAIDIIITPTRVIKTKKTRNRPCGIYWELLTEDKLNEVPILKEIYEKRKMKK